MEIAPSSCFWQSMSSNRGLLCKLGCGFLNEILFDKVKCSYLIFGSFLCIKSKFQLRNPIPKCLLRLEPFSSLNQSQKSLQLKIKTMQIKNPDRFCDLCKITMWRASEARSYKLIYNFAVKNQIKVCFPIIKLTSQLILRLSACTLCVLFAPELPSQFSGSILS